MKLYTRSPKGRYAEATDAEVITEAVHLLHANGLTKAGEFITHELVRVALLPRYVGSSLALSQKEGIQATKEEK